MGVGSLRLRDSAAAAGLLSFENAEQAPSFVLLSS